MCLLAGCVTLTVLISELIDRSQKKLVVIDCHTLAYQPLGTINPLSVSVDCCPFRTPHKKNGITRGLLCPASYTQCHCQGSSM